MSTYQDDAVHDLVVVHGAAATINLLLSDVEANRSILAYLLEEGIVRVEHRTRNRRRVLIKATQLAETVRPPTPAQPRYATAAKEIRRRTVGLLASWFIGAVALGDFDKVGLLRAAVAEERAGHGHLVNAKLYRELADPLTDSQLVKDHWADEGVRLLHQSILDELTSAVAARPVPHSRAAQPSA